MILTTRCTYFAFWAYSYYVTTFFFYLRKVILLNSLSNVKKSKTNLKKNVINVFNYKLYVYLIHVSNNKIIRQKIICQIFLFTIDKILLTKKIFLTLNTSLSNHWYNCLSDNLNSKKEWRILSNKTHLLKRHRYQSPWHLLSLLNQCHSLF